MGTLPPGVSKANDTEFAHRQSTIGNWQSEGNRGIEESGNLSGNRQTMTRWFSIADLGLSIVSRLPIADCQLSIADA
jgi:hypothetical protein